MNQSQKQYNKIINLIQEGDIQAQKKYMWLAARTRARRNSIIFTIKIEDIDIPSICPILNIELKINLTTGRAKDNSPSLDRINPSLGYIPSNILVISHRANTIKGDSTIEELRLMLENW